MPNVSPAAYGAPANPARSRYGRAIVNMYSDLQDCWPCDDAIGATSLRNLVSGGVALDTFATANSTSTVYPGRPSLLGNDPLGRCVHLMGGAAYHAAAYTMPSSGTLEMLCSTVSGVGSATSDSSIFGNWNGSGIALLQAVVGASVRIYRDSSFTQVQLVAADFTPTMHWALSWDGTTQRFYINGIQRVTQTVGAPSAGGYVGLGVYSSAAHYCSGRFQWIAIYKRALSATEIASHAALVVQPS